MFRENFHLSDRDLLLWADGELPRRRTAAIQRHLNACWTCRARIAEQENAIVDFVRLYRHELDAQLPPAEGPRALLKARLAELTASPSAGGNVWPGRMLVVRAATVIAVLFLSARVAMRIAQHEDHRVSKMGAIPNVQLTPGATIPIGLQDVCNSHVAANDPDVPDPLKREVLKEYGLNDAPANAYEIDYLVTPELGGAANIRNLWPQPSLNAVWNARVKDALEDRLHSLVCSGQLDLGTAQREISQDWVAAYKKYFRTNQPLQEHSAPKSIGRKVRPMEDNVQHESA
jgi:hypothetical protein